jgi:predicted nucleic acid-binding protein
MTNSADLLLDTSAAIALLSPDHQFHQQVENATIGQTLGLSGHALFETLSVLTRNPTAAVTMEDALAMVEDNFPATVHLDPKDAARLPRALASGKISGGQVYDALVAACAQSHKLPLLTCDQRAQPTYAIIGVQTVIVT